MNLEQAVRELIECWEEIRIARYNEYYQCNSTTRSTHDQLFKAAQQAGERKADLEALLDTLPEG